ncbi:MAG: hypothetical protein E6G92_02435 [Alphaproteobacteria bacterium]|nr:MAG: hypothetical protein E6G92_02435 [Alphaproteobacteria bacterium]
MKRSIAAGLVPALLLSAAQPAVAADFAEARDVQAGAFAGVRLRLPLGGDRGRRGVQAGLAVAPAVLSTTMDGRSRRGIAEGIELGLRDREPVALRLAGTRIDRLGVAPASQAPGGRRAGVSTLGWIGIGVGTIVVAVAIGTAILAHEISENDE